ncbi:hypothetical protein CPLU01_07545 [Colletotrichum plurivorum]|uniref:Uncharacterized protein n=1 Tax=Colletotrichum plurivorum TaxID=2175906 RepID=A0A8H6KFJ1_9PEZI|nr:hypothetical protein CPLU01_07545 [Colletotrichum plurivorum]
MERDDMLTTLTLRRDGVVEARRLFREEWIVTQLVSGTTRQSSGDEPSEEQTALNDRAEDQSEPSKAGNVPMMPNPVFDADAIINSTSTELIPF